MRAAVGCLWPIKHLCPALLCLVFTGSSGHSPHPTCVNMRGVVGLSPDQAGEQRVWGPRTGDILVSPSLPESSWVGEL